MITLLLIALAGYVGIWILSIAVKPTPKTKIDELIEILKED